MTTSPTATYRSVAILAPGEFTDMSGRHVSFSAKQLAELARDYNAAQPAALNLDHRASGPALGRNRALRYDHVRSLLLADIEGVPSRLARAIERGRWPGRSAELAVHRDVLGQARLELRGVALLGARRPAVEGLPPMPPRADPGAVAPHSVAAESRFEV